jgi:histidyl-tRNA synthetase
VPGMGWGAGIERLSMLIAAPGNAAAPVAVIPMNDESQAPALDVLKFLRGAGVAAETAYSGNAKKRLERANKSGATFAVLVGTEIKLKNLADGTQQDVALADLPGLLRA